MVGMKCQEEELMNWMVTLIEIMPAEEQREKNELRKMNRAP